MSKITERIKNESRTLTSEFKRHILASVITALGVVAALAWNDAIQAFIKEVFPLSNSTVMAKFIYAVIITSAVVIFSVYIARSDREEAAKKP